MGFKLIVEILKQDNIRRFGYGSDIGQRFDYSDTRICLSRHYGE